MLSQVSVFADTAEVPMLLTIKEAPIDISVTESIQLETTEGSSDLSISPFIITNNDSYDIFVSSIEVQTEPGWELVPSNTDFTSAESKNKISVYFSNGYWDFSDGSLEGPSAYLDSGDSIDTTQFITGKISSKQEAMSSSKIAQMIFTVERLKYIDFKIGESYCSIRNDISTWAGWISAGSLHSEGYVINDSGYVVSVDNRQLCVATSDNVPVKSTDKIISENYILLDLSSI